MYSHMFYVRIMKLSIIFALVSHSHFKQQIIIKCALAFVFIMFRNIIFQAYLKHFVFLDISNINATNDIRIKVQKKSNLILNSLFMLKRPLPFHYTKHKFAFSIVLHARKLVLLLCPFCHTRNFLSICIRFLI